MTNFSKKVLDLTKQIPKGKITTYKQLATAAGNPEASRAAGSALNKNALLVIIPCHHVIKSTGEIGGYSGGKEKKLALLKKEGIPIKEGKIINLKHYLHKFKN
ncbi:MAG: cysteine methyltransferase [Candidatus Nanohalarchaeota archaeon]|nr:MAG: cysteine methyltransferase [Candidatus Nanohaloarchaeota archaeon]